MAAPKPRTTSRRRAPAKSPTPEAFVELTVRVPQSMHARISELAAAHERSIAGEIRFVLLAEITRAFGGDPSLAGGGR